MKAQPMDSDRNTNDQHQFEIKQHEKIIPLKLQELRQIVSTKQVDANCPARRIGDAAWSTVQNVLREHESDKRRPTQTKPSHPAVSQTKPSSVLPSPTADSLDDEASAGTLRIIEVTENESPTTVTTHQHRPRSESEPDLGITATLKTSIRQGAAQAVGAVLNETSREIDDSECIAIKKQLILGSSPRHSDWLVSDSSVAAKHAIIQARGHDFVLRDLGSLSGTFLNNFQLVPGNDYPLSEGAIIRIGSARFRFMSNQLYVETSGKHAHLVCRKLSHTVPVPGGTRCILDNVTLEIEPRQFVVILGPSGSGKSTLMKALNGQIKSTQGTVLLNHEDLYSNFDRLKRRLANVPQKDLFHESLSLSTSLTYTAALRLQQHKTANEKSSRVKEVIQAVGIEKRANDPISKYSGGEKKRASLANELLADPSLLLIDEATSGLDDKSDREIMEKLKASAMAGKTVVCITHNLNNVFEFADQIIVMSEGGRLAFMGSPREALLFFSMNHLAELYSRLKHHPSQHWQHKFKETSQGKRFQAIANSPDEAERLSITRSPVSLVQHWSLAMRHGTTVLRRLCALHLKDIASLAVTIAQPVFVFGLIFIVFGSIVAETAQPPANGKIEGYCPECAEYYDGMGILFLLAVSALWFGCNNASKELIKEKELYLRERAAGLSPLGYLSAKSLLLTFVTLTQTFLLLWATQYTSGLKGPFLAYFTPMLFVSLCGVGLGLTISALSSNTDVAATAVPLAMIPQVILAGNLKSLEGFSEKLAWFVAPSHWCYGALTNVWNSQFSKVPSDVLRDDMFTQQHYWISLVSLIAFSAMLFLLSKVQVSRRNY